jgi:hypothetical protein
MRGVVAKREQQERDSQDIEGEAPTTGIFVAPFSCFGPVADAAADRRSAGASDALEPGSGRPAS